MSLKILCLHGKSQNKEIFRTKLGSIPRKLKKLATLKILNAPFRLDENPDDDVKDAYTWFHKDSKNNIDISSINQSILYLQSEWEENGPYDGIIAFSMGGTMASIMCNKEFIDYFFNLKFLICIGSPDIPDSYGNIQISNHINSLHFGGEKDLNVDIESSKRLSNHFTSPRFISHEFGHCIPMKSQYINEIVKFVEENLVN